MNVGITPAKFGLIWFSASSGEDLNVNVFDVRRTPSDGKSSLCLGPGELKNMETRDLLFRVDKAIVWF